jgi:tetratricopeptide (TPR) repeat protein
MARAATGRQLPSKYEDCALFCEFLCWHLFVWGTRPKGSPDSAGKPWTIKEFAIALGAGAHHQTLETEQRKIRDWLEGKYGPSNIPAIEEALFGSNPAWKNQRLALRRAPIRRNDESPAHPQRSGSQPNSSKSLLFNVPSQLSLFIGRTDALSRVHAALEQRKRVIRVALHGMRGVGKTCLAVEYAYQYADFYDGVWWCFASTREELLNSLWLLALELGAVPKDERNLATAAAAALKRLAQQTKPWLLVYDNVPSPEVLADLLPTAKTRVLITSTFSDWVGWATEISVPELPIDDAVEFLTVQVGGNDPSGARTLSETLGYLPLALDHAAAYCRRTGMHFVEYAARVELLIKRAPRSRHYPKTVYATFSMALREAAKLCPSTTKLMTFMAYCAPDPIPAPVIEGAISNEAERLEAISCLAEVSLIRHQFLSNGTTGITVHRLVQRVARLRSAGTRSTSAAIRRLVQTLSTFFPTDIFYEPSSWEGCATLAPHVLALRRNAKNNLVAGNWPDLLAQVGTYFHARASYPLAHDLLSTAVAASEDRHGPEHITTARCLNALGHLLQSKGEFSLAKSTFERALPLFEGALGTHHQNTIACLNNLGLTLQLRGDFPGAGRFFERALELAESALPEDNPLCTQIMNNLAVLTQLEGDLEGALSLYNQTLDRRKRILGPTHPNTLLTQNALAVLLSKMGSVEHAIKLHTDTLELREQIFGPEHPVTATALNNLAGALQNAGKSQAARPLLERALAIREKVLGLDHPDTAQSLHNLANVFEDQGEYTSARELYERAVALSERTLGTDHPSTDSYLSGLASLLHQTRDLDSSRSIFERVLKNRERRFGLDHIDIAETLSNLGATLTAQGELALAEECYVRAIRIQERSFGENDPELARTLHNLGGLQNAQRKYSRAQVMYERALDIRKRTLGEEHPDTALSIYGLACAVEGQGGAEVASRLTQTALNAQVNILGQNHPHTNLSRAKLAVLQLTLGNAKEAAALATQALQAHEEKLGPTHPWTIDSAMTAIEALDALGRADEANAVRARFDVS